MKRLKDIYAETADIHDSALYCLFANAEPIDFEEAMQEDKLRINSEKRHMGVGNSSKRKGKQAI